MPKDYKDTLNLPRTDFPMKANLTQNEPRILRFWETKHIYEELQEKNRNNRHYIVHDGPPYANGYIHIGHALNKVLKDIIVKYKTMRGFYSPFVPGWDCHGLPIELQVDKSLGDKKDRLNILEKRKLCKEYAEKFVHIQKDEFKRIGVFGDWKEPYLTMHNQYEATIVREFCKFVQLGYVYKGKKPVHWCPSCVTALAEAEVEYGDKESPSIFVKFKVKNIPEEKKVHFDEFPQIEHYFVAWTTTPWTLVANMALCLHPSFNYSFVKVNVGHGRYEIYIIAEELRERCMEKFGLKFSEDAANIGEYKRIYFTSGKNLEGIICRHPFIDRESRVIIGEYVTMEDGTGVVHTAPGHGEEDYAIGLKYGLDVYAPVDAKGCFTGEVKDFAGQNVFKANQGIIEKLKGNNTLLGAPEKISHSYPHCWRCKKPVIFRATEQWFISMEKNKLRERCLAEIDNITWIPGWGRDRIYGMVANRPDWCISRQRAWGVPITLLKCDGCKEFVTDPVVLSGIVKLVEEYSADVWFIKKPEDILPPGYICKKCGGTSFSKETDILDVWFDSGVSHAAVMEEDMRLYWPADMYLEGSDQHRGWFQSSLLASVGTRGRAPYRTVLTHGFVVDGRGKKMSKSLGNVIAPQEVIKTNGAEILRLWVSAEDYREDIRISKEIIDRLTEAYRKIRNTCRFLLGNIYDFDVRDYSKDLLEIDRWAMSRLQTFTNKVISAYEKFDFYEVFHNIYNFCVVDMSSFYLDVLKDRLYTFKFDSAERRASQWVLYNIVSTMTRLMAPIVSFTAEEVWQNMRQRAKSVEHRTENMEESVFLAPLPEVNEEYHDRELEKKWDALFVIRNEVNKALEIKRAERFIGNSLEAKIVIYMPEEYKTLSGQYRDFLPAFFIVSAVEIADGNIEGAYKSTELEGLEIKVEHAPGAKCHRCWNWSESVGEFAEAPDICKRCHKVLFEK
ncbi:MAG: isoleucine--tRNA ligase [Nitrospirae bacterium]|nr:isoleucine--tRNA ligase [Nitrospirota bacterium]